MTMKATKGTEVKVKVNIRPEPVSPTQKQAWRILWQKLITDSKHELKPESEAHKND